MPAFFDCSNEHLSGGTDIKVYLIAMHFFLNVSLNSEIYSFIVLINK